MLFRLIIAAVVLSAGLPVSGSAQTRERLARAAVELELDALHADLKRSYYDADFHGMNIDSLYEVAKKEVVAAKTDQERFRAVQRFLETLQDSHTYFVAPGRVALNDYHFAIQFLADKPFVMGVDLGSQAYAAGLMRGHEIRMFDGTVLTRDNYYRVLSDFLASNPTKPLNLMVVNELGAISEIRVVSDTTEIYRLKGSEFRKRLSAYQDSLERAQAHVQATIADSIFFWRLPMFMDRESKSIDKVMERARKHAVLVLDLRGNPGGSLETLTNFVEHFVDHEVVVGDLHERVTTKKFIAKPRKQIFNGRLLILVDSETGSAAEIFTRLMQIEKKAIVYGDRTAGAVLAAKFFQYDDQVGASITVSDFVLPNGERLENVGVTPDVPVVPTAKYLMADTDPVLSYVLLKAGARVPPAAAAGLLMAKPR